MSLCYFLPVSHYKRNVVFHMVKKVKSAYDPIVAHQAGAYPGFCSMKRLGVFLLLPGWDASPSQGYPRN